MFADIKHFLKIALTALAAVALAGVFGCGERPSRMAMTQVPPPPGGSVIGLQTLEVEETTHLIGVAKESLWVRDAAEGGWTRRAVEWPTQIEATGLSPLGSLSNEAEPANVPAHQLITTHQGRIWLLARPDPQGPPRLMVSADAGRNWQLVSLPRTYRREDPSQGAAPARPGTRTLRLMDHADQGLYLLDPSHLWRARFADGGDGLVQTWDALDVSEVVARPAGRPRGTRDNDAPRTLRNYLPATESRPFELVTVFQERLYVYRRHIKSDRWILVGTLPTIDRELLAVPGSGTVYMAAPEAIYRSPEFGEQWQRLTITKPLNRTPSLRAVALKPPGESPGLATLIAGTDRGGIFRSQDGGDTWRRVHDADPDRRGITGVVADPHAQTRDHWWASTAGIGVLRSNDDGVSWSESNNQLRATHPLDIAIGAKGEFMVGTEAGLFRLTGAPAEGNWDSFHGRATSSVHFDASTSRILSGTLGGAIVTKAPDGELTVSEVGMAPTDEAPLYQPWQASQAADAASAILSIKRRPNSRDLFAWSRQRGLLVSTDGGVSWRRSTLNTALVSALEHSVITNFIVDHGQRMYLTSHDFAGSDSPQLWHSYDNGESWHAVYSFSSGNAHVPLLLERGADDPTEMLYLGHGGQLAASKDGGTSWTNIEGPWEGGTIRSMRLDGNRQSVVYNDRHASRVVLGPDVQNPDAERLGYTLRWPDSSAGPKTELRDAVVFQQFVYAVTGSDIYAGSLPEGTDQLPHAPLIIATFIVLFFIAMLSFLYLRFRT
jgi:photosystem II stability/assembly factor-like uncharacterized protein